ncbi:hypothetical protein V6N13_040482 [Hibiscus sabdariffa]|uniref:Dof zinc finger protein n=1 Tax=Hibiscus sabdariffa TaxID=183260 RepID=A0ABR2R8I0_9ROSI
MQDIHSIVGGGRIFSGGGGGGDRRLRLQNQPLKCPRCDSLNTKFCYYNNYNLSQPRHFCKSCRRYWTRGGLLRNIPVGGGCRKAKRSKTKPTPETHQFKDNSHSSSEGSNSNSNNNKNSSAEAASGVVASHSSFLNVSDSKLYGNPYNSGLTTEIGSLNDETVPFGFGTTEQAQWLQQLKMVSMGENEIITGGLLLDQTVQVELSGLHNRSEGGGFGPFDWEGSGDERTALVDLCNQTDDQTYWNQYDPTLYLP